MSGGGAAMPEAVATKLKELCGISFVEGYGLTETMAPTHVNPPDRPKQQCLGIPIFDIDSTRGRSGDARGAAGGRGRRDRLHGPADLPRLLEQPQGDRGSVLRARRQALVFRTGDLGRMDEDGYFFLVDRLKRMINASGLKVWPAEVESLLYGHPDVQEACVIAREGRASRRDGEGGRGAQARAARPGERRGDHRMGARQDGGLQGAAHRRVRRLAAASPPPARSSGGCCRSARTPGPQLRRAPRVAGTTPWCSPALPRACC